ncbi:unnamed protein product [Phytophthora fragariaefolia]|uniref:Unnamed protein product n=1 Tax=Phytophthora fragariaefolia TaxID=1490495 RepID=A0A9W6U2L4_9STRA|nr:unnamed protein product [Phytophthora fragariaefolia]
MLTSQFTSQNGGATDPDDERDSPKAGGTTGGSTTCAQPPGDDPPVAHYSANASEPRSSRSKGEAATIHKHCQGIALAQSTKGAPSTGHRSSPAGKSSPMQLLKTQLQHSVLAHGCVHKWASSTPPSTLAATDMALSDENADTNTTTDDAPDDSEEKTCSQTKDIDGAAAIA